MALVSECNNTKNRNFCSNNTRSRNIFVTRDGIYFVLDVHIGIFQSAGNKFINDVLPFAKFGTTCSAFSSLRLSSFLLSIHNAYYVSNLHINMQGGKESVRASVVISFQAWN